MLKEAKKPLGVTTRTIQRWDKEGRMERLRLSGQLAMAEERGKSCIRICEGFLFNAER